MHACMHSRMCVCACTCTPKGIRTWTATSATTRCVFCCLTRRGNSGERCRGSFGVARTTASPGHSPDPTSLASQVRCVHAREEFGTRNECLNERNSVQFCPASRRTSVALSSVRLDKSAHPYNKWLVGWLVILITFHSSLIRLFVRSFVVYVRRTNAQERQGVTGSVKPGHGCWIWQ